MGVTTTLIVPSIKTFHVKTYPAISPLREGLSQAGRTILITGGGGGIGFQIARSFIKASSARVIVIGRRKDVISNAVSELVAEAKELGSPTKVAGHAVDVADPQAVAKLWKSLTDDGIHIDVLVLNAAVAGPENPILEVDIDAVWKTFDINVKSLLDFAQRFHKQGGDKKKYLVNVSSSAVHKFWTDAPTYPTYGLTKNAGTLLLQQIAKDIDADTLQIVNFHPGAIYTEAAKNAGFKETDWDWDSITLPADFGVWAATDEAKFLHGRWVDAHWDIDEVKGPEIRKVLEEDKNFMRIGLSGVTDTTGWPTQ